MNVNLLIIWLAAAVIGHAALPDQLTCTAMPTYLHRPSGRSGREITVNLSGAPLTSTGTIVVTCGGTTEQFPIAANPKGSTQFTVMLPHGMAVNSACEASIKLLADQREAVGTVSVPAQKQLTIHLLMHSHVDIGYTAVQTEIAKKQSANVARALELIEATRDFPEGSRFKWNIEVYWPAQQFLKMASAEQKLRFQQAIRDGNIGIDAMHTNLLTGVCRAEELIRAFEPATELGRQNGVHVRSMMISDVPGLTWGIIPSLNQAGIRYISDGANAAVGLTGDRVGYVRVLWENQPFWWIGPNGKDRVLYWGAQGGYSFGHHYPSFSKGVRVLLDRLNEWHYQHEVVQMRWTKGDNGAADESVMPEVRDWNAKYAFPRVVISTTAEAFKDFEQRCGNKIPEFKGDFTPYWEDGVPSAAREAGINRLASDRLARAETMWTINGNADYPAAEFGAAWDNVLLWSEHTWGAHCSVSQPDSDFSKAQWSIKQSYALAADAQSKKLLDLAMSKPHVSLKADACDVWNTNSWTRSEVVTLSAEQSKAGDRVRDASGRIVASQRLQSQALIFLANDVPSMGAKRFTIESGNAADPQARVNVAADGLTLDNGIISVKVDATSGAITSLRHHDMADELAQGAGINSYTYLAGSDITKAISNGPVTIRVDEHGPLLASISIDSTAPGCERLRREIQLAAGADHVEIINTVDKQPIRTKEGVHFGFHFNIADCETRINSAWAVARVEKDQIPGACRNWYSVERWADVSNATHGVTLATIEAPMMEVGGLTANLPNMQPNPDAYLKKISASPLIYSWVMNNHWHTNYRADQQGGTVFHYFLRPHGRYDETMATRFGIESTQPLLITQASGKSAPESFVSLDSPEVMINSMKPGNDGKSRILRLFNTADRDMVVHLDWHGHSPKQMWISNLAEDSVTPVTKALEVPARSVMTLKVEP